jgi:outer membrane protein assembly factor BamB
VRLPILLLLVVVLAGCPGGTANPLSPQGGVEPPSVVTVAAPVVAEDAGAPAAPPAPVVMETPAAAASGADWPTFHGDNGRTGRSAAPAITHPRVRWSADVGIQGYLNSPLVSGGRVVVPSSGTSHDKPDAADGIYALDLASGRVLWHARTDNDANGAALAQDRAVVTSDDGTVRAVDLGDGHELWKRRASGKVFSNPLVVGDAVVVGDAAGNVSAFALSDGLPRWHAKLHGAIRGGLAADDRTVYAVSQGGDVAAFGLDGALRWKKAVTRLDFDGKAQVPIEGYPAPLVAGDLLVVPFARDTYYDTPALVALACTTGDVRWFGRRHGKDDWGNIRSTPALAEDMTLVYSEPYSGDVVGVDARSGNVRYRRTVGACFFPQYGSAAIAGTVAYVPRFDGVLYAVGAGDGGVLWSIYLGDKALTSKPPPKAVGSHCEWDVPSGSPLYSPVAIAPDGTVIAGNGAGTLFAIEEVR